MERQYCIISSKPTRNSLFRREGKRGKTEYISRAIRSKNGPEPFSKKRTSAMVTLRRVARKYRVSEHVGRMAMSASWNSILTRSSWMLSVHSATISLAVIQDPVICSSRPSPPFDLGSLLPRGWFTLIFEKFLPFVARRQQFPSTKDGVALAHFSDARARRGWQQRTSCERGLNREEVSSVRVHRISRKSRGFRRVSPFEPHREPENGVGGG